MPNSYGIIVEGAFDRAVFVELIRKIREDALPVHSRDCGGLPKLKKNFPALLGTLENAHNGNPVDRALVIRDSDGGDPAALEEGLRGRVEGKEFAFRYGVRFYAVSQKMETLLLADADAINRVAQARGVFRRKATRPQMDLETIPNPKEHVLDLFSLAGLLYTAEACGEVAADADLDLIRRYCPSIENFISKVVER